MSNSTFPHKIDNIPLFLDVSQDDGELIKQFEEYMLKNDFNNANMVLHKIDSYDQKIITADRLNLLRSCILALEKFYGTDFKPYIEGKQKEWEAIVDKFSFKGIYSDSISYGRNNMVLFYLKGEYHMFIKTTDDRTPGIVPIDTNNWRDLTVKGETGITNSFSTNFCFEWKSSQNYTKHDIVSFKNEWWIALKSNLDSAPKRGNDNWELILNALQPKYPVQELMPENQAVGELWFKVV